MAKVTPEHNSLGNSLQAARKEAESYFCNQKDNRTTKDKFGEARQCSKV